MLVLVLYLSDVARNWRTPADRSFFTLSASVFPLFLAITSNELLLPREVPLWLCCLRYWHLLLQWCFFPFRFVMGFAEIWQDWCRNTWTIWQDWFERNKLRPEMKPFGLTYPKAWVTRIKSCHEWLQVVEDGWGWALCNSKRRRSNQPFPNVTQTFKNPFL